MNWRNRLDPARRSVAQLRDRARQIDLRAINYRQQLARVRRVGLRAEVLVPLIAVLLLATALGLSALSSGTAEVAVSTPTTEIGSAVAEIPSPSAQSSVAGYPGPLGDITPTTYSDVPLPETETMTSTFPLTDTQIAGIDPSDGGYPAPDLGPIGVDPADDGSLPAAPPPFPTAPPYSPPTTYNPPPVIYPTTPPVAGGGGGGYPAPEPAPQPTSAPPVDQPNDPPVPSSPAEGSTPDPALPATPDTGPPPVDAPTESPTSAVPPTATTPPVPPTATPRPSDIISGNVRWGAAQSPVSVDRDVAIAAGSTLTIDPGVEVRVAPGVQITVGGTLRAQGAAGAPVRFVGQGGRWDGLAATQGGTIVLDHADVRQAGRSGTAISATGASLTIHDTSLSESGGGIVSIGSALDLRSTTISGNAITGPTVNVQLPSRAATTIVGNVLGGNGTPAGSQQIAIAAGEAAGPFVIEGNVIAATPSSGGMVITTGIPLEGSIRCNSFSGGTIGLQINARTPDASGFRLAIENNAFAGQSRFGMTGSVGFNVANNWWNDPSGPSDASRNPGGRGVPIGVNQQFQPWLGARPTCAPAQ